VEGQPTKAVLAQTYMVVLFICSVSDTIYAMIFLPKTPADRLANRRKPQHETIILNSS
jgi:hypothetical protein